MATHDFGSEASVTPVPRDDGAVHFRVKPIGKPISERLCEWALASLWFLAAAALVAATVSPQLETRHRALIAAQPAAWPVLQGMLDELVELVPVHTMADALQVLQHDPDTIDLIVCTLTFSDHRMMEFLLTVKGDPRTSHIPFIACRVLVGRLSEELVKRMGAVAGQCGAEFINVPAFSPDEARDAFRQAVKRCLGV